MGPQEAHVWSVDIGTDVAPAANLSADELQRAAQISSEDARRRFVVTRSKLRQLLAEQLEIDPADLVFGATANGKPKLADDALRFNASHSGDLALIAIAKDREVGVDVERIDPKRDTSRIQERLFTSAERAAIAAGGPEAFYRHWVAKEAFVKASARGVMSVRSFEVVLEAPGGPRLLHVGGDHEEATRWTLTELDVRPGYAAALVVHGTDATVTQHGHPT